MTCDFGCKTTEPDPMSVWLRLLCVIYLTLQGFTMTHVTASTATTATVAIITTTTTATTIKNSSSTLTKTLTPSTTTPAPTMQTTSSTPRATKPSSLTTTATMLTNPITLTAAAGPVGQFSCAAPPLIANGLVKTKGPYNSVSTRAEYKCFEGYRLQGAPYILCTPLGWGSLAPTCLYDPRQPSVNTDVEVEMQEDSATKWYMLLLIVVVVIACLVALSVWCCKTAGCFHGNAVSPYSGQYRQVGSCCCRTVLMNADQGNNNLHITRPADEFALSTLQTQRVAKSVTSSNRGDLDHPCVVTPRQGHTVYKDNSDGKLINNLTEKSVPTAKKPPVWMPHTNHVRNINTSTH